MCIPAGQHERIDSQLIADGSSNLQRFEVLQYVGTHLVTHGQGK